jgi:hypothetical protein
MGYLGGRFELRALPLKANKKIEALVHVQCLITPRPDSAYLVLVVQSRSSVARSERPLRVLPVPAKPRLRLR